jgi:site-specific recombinase XerC
MAFLSWDEVVALAETIHSRYRALIYVAVDSGMRWSELVGLRRQRVDLGRCKIRVTDQLIRLQSGEWVRKEPKTMAGVRSITISFPNTRPASVGARPAGHSRSLGDRVAARDEAAQRVARDAARARLRVDGLHVAGCQVR